MKKKPKTVANGMLKGRGVEALFEPPTTSKGEPEANEHPTVPVTIDLSAEVTTALEELHETGLFGLTFEAVIEELVRAGVRDAMVRGWVTPPEGMRVEGGELRLTRRR